MMKKKKSHNRRSFSLLHNIKEKERRKKKTSLLAAGVCFGFVFLIILFCLVKGNNEETQNVTTTVAPVSTSDTLIETTNEIESQVTTFSMPETTTVQSTIVSAPEFNILEIAEYSGTPYVEINGNLPYFVEDDYTTTTYEYYSPLDSLGRCGFACACIGVEIFPTEPRGEIGDIKPSGWHTVRYDDIITDRYLYNRCHLIGYQLSGENNNPLNLITGTRYMNIEGMLPFENRVYDYILSTNNHVLYRSTPIFENENLVASGVLLEAFSVEDYGKGICFNVFTYNVQPGIIVDYATGESHYAMVQEDDQTDVPERTITEDITEPEITYILNRNSKKFHYPTCSSVEDMKESNKIYSHDSRDTIISSGYVPCKRCNP